MNCNDLLPWVFGCITALGLAWAPVSCTNLNNEKIEAAIKNGVDPIIAQCVYSGSPDRAACAIATMQKTK